MLSFSSFSLFKVLLLESEKAEDKGVAHFCLEPTKVGTGQILCKYDSNVTF